MPPERFSSHYPFDLNMVDPQLLDTSDGFHNAIRALEGVCHRGDPEIAGAISVLMTRSHILEYIVSGMLCMPMTLSIISTAPIILLPSAG